MNKFRSAKKLIAEHYGEEGTKERDEFHEEAYSYYYGEILKDRRKELHMTQEQLAEKIGKKREYISRVENGEDIRISNLLEVAGGLGGSLSFTWAPA